MHRGPKLLRSSYQEEFFFHYLITYPSSTNFKYADWEADDATNQELLVEKPVIYVNFQSGFFTK